jgi:hypothetical protein
LRGLDGKFRAVDIAPWPLAWNYIDPFKDRALPQNGS